MANTEKYLALALSFRETDLDLALKNAYIAAATSFNPRADVCCLLGEIYLLRGNKAWSKAWYEKALYNNQADFEGLLPDQQYIITIPMLKLGFIAFEDGDTEKAREYFEGVLKADPDNEIAKDNLLKVTEEKQD